MVVYKVFYVLNLELELTFSIVRILYQTELKDSWALKIEPEPPHTEIEDNDTDTDEQTFALEKYLEEFILTKL